MSNRLQGLFPLIVLTSLITPVCCLNNSAAVAVSNLNRPIAGAGAGDFILGNNRELAVRFDTAAGAVPYSLEAISVRLRGEPSFPQPFNGFQLTLHNDGPGEPGAELALLLGDAPVTEDERIFSYVPAESVVLEPAVSYWVVASLESGGALWCGPIDRGEDGMAGWGISDDFMSRMGLGGNWGPWWWENRQMPPLLTLSLEVETEPLAVPEPPATAGITALGLLISAGWLRWRSVRAGCGPHCARGSPTPPTRR